MRRNQSHGADNKKANGSHPSAAVGAKRAATFLHLLVPLPAKGFNQFSEIVVVTLHGFDDLHNEP